MQIPKMKNGSILLVHDTNHPTHNYRLEKSIEWLKKDHECITLPYGYGLSIIKINNDIINVLNSNRNSYHSI